MNIANFRWQRDSKNPVLPPDPNSKCESTHCMNPFVVRVDNEYRLYYSGGDDDRIQRICLATASVGDPSRFTRHGVILDIGKEEKLPVLLF